MAFSLTAGLPCRRPVSDAPTEDGRGTWAVRHIARLANEHPQEGGNRAQGFAQGTAHQEGRGDRVPDRGSACISRCRFGAPRDGRRLVHRTPRSRTRRSTEPPAPSTTKSGRTAPASSKATTRSASPAARSTCPLTIYGDHTLVAKTWWEVEGGGKASATQNVRRVVRRRLRPALPPPPPRPHPRPPARPGRAGQLARRRAAHAVWHALVVHVEDRSARRSTGRGMRRVTFVVNGRVVRTRHRARPPPSRAQALPRRGNGVQALTVRVPLREPHAGPDHPRRALRAGPGRAAVHRLIESASGAHGGRRHGGHPLASRSRRVAHARWRTVHAVIDNALARSDRQDAVAFTEPDFQLARGRRRPAHARHRGHAARSTSAPRRSSAGG